MLESNEVKLAEKILRTDYAAVYISAGEDSGGLRLTHVRTPELHESNIN